MSCSSSDLSNSTSDEGEDEEEEQLALNVYAEYKPTKLKFEGSKHPDPVVETASLSSVEPPDITYTLSIPESTIVEGKLSALQLESIIYACQQHENFLPNGDRAGFLIGDGAGVGKGRSLAGIIFENYLCGRTRALWISISKDLLYDASRDLKDIEAFCIPCYSLSKLKYAAISSAANNYINFGVIYCTYSTLISRTQQKIAEFKSRLDQIVDWCGEEFDGVIVFDECHKAKNLCSIKMKPTKVGIAVLELQNRLPKARVVYASATGASEPRNMAYMTRLGIWGEGTPFLEFQDFMIALKKRGVLAMELVAMDMKLRGMYIARQLSFQGVTFYIEKVPLTEDFIAMYNKSVELWIEAKRRFEEAASLVPVVHKHLWGHFWGAHQRFFKYLCISVKIKQAVAVTKQAIREGKCVVIGLQSTGESYVLQQLARKNSKLLDFISSPKMVFESLVMKQFPDPDKQLLSNSKTNKDFNGKRSFFNPSPADSFKRWRSALCNSKIVIESDVISDDDSIIEAGVLSYTGINDYLTSKGNEAITNKLQSKNIANTTVVKKQARTIKTSDGKNGHENKTEEMQVFKRMSSEMHDSSHIKSTPRKMSSFLKNQHLSPQNECTKCLIKRTPPQVNNQKDLSRSKRRKGFIREKTSPNKLEFTNAADIDKRPQIMTTSITESDSESDMYCNQRRLSTCKIKKGYLRKKTSTKTQYSNPFNKHKQATIMNESITDSSSESDVYRNQSLLSRRKTKKDHQNIKSSFKSKCSNSDNVKEQRIGIETDSDCESDVFTKPVKNRRIKGRNSFLFLKTKKKSCRPVKSTPSIRSVAVSYRDINQMSIVPEKYTKLHKTGKSFGGSRKNLNMKSNLSPSKYFESLIDKYFGDTVQNKSLSETIGTPESKYSPDISNRKCDKPYAKDIGSLNHDETIEIISLSSYNESDSNTSDFTELVSPEGCYQAITENRKCSGISVHKNLPQNLVSTSVADLTLSESNSFCEFKKDSIPQLNFNLNKNRVLALSRPTIEDYYQNSGSSKNKRSSKTIGHCGSPPSSQNCEENNIRSKISQMKEELLQKIEELGAILPKSSLDQLILELGGSKCVAEMTGRRGRIVLRNNRVHYESRVQDSAVELVNIKEKEYFMEGIKEIAIISDASSSGISLHSDRRVKNQKKRMHITLELPWSADKAIQQFGRSHRSNQVIAPEYIFLISDLAGERRFASIIAKRLESLGALTHGDRRATESYDLTQFNFDNRYGTKSLRNILNSILNLEEPQVPYLLKDSNFLNDVSEALAGVGMFVTSENNSPQLCKNPYNIAKFLNRILGMSVELQNKLFTYFTETFAEIILTLKKSGKLDLGIKDLGTAGEKIRRTKVTKFQRKLSSGSASVDFSEFYVERGLSFENALIIWKKLSGQKQGFYLGHLIKNGKREVILVEALNNQSSDTWNNKYIVYKPHLGLQFSQVTLKEISQKFYLITADEAKPIWEHHFYSSETMCSHVYWFGRCSNRERMVECEIGLRRRRYYLLSGCVLSVWIRLEAKIGRKMRIIRIKTEEDLKIVGIIVPHNRKELIKEDLAIDSEYVCEEF